MTHRALNLLYPRPHRSLEAVPLLKRAMELSLELYDPQLSPAIADTQIALADCLIDLGERAQARSLFTQAKAIHARHTRRGEHVARPLRELERRLTSAAPRTKRQDRYRNSGRDDRVRRPGDIGPELARMRGSSPIGMLSDGGLISAKLLCLR